MQSRTSIFESTYNRWHRFIFLRSMRNHLILFATTTSQIYTRLSFIRVTIHYRDLLYLFKNKVGANLNISIIAQFLKHFRFFYRCIFIFYRRHSKRKEGSGGRVIRNYAILFEIAIYIYFNDTDSANIKDNGKNDGIHLQDYNGLHARMEIGIMLQKKGTNHVFFLSLCQYYLTLQLIINCDISFSCSYSF